MIVSQGKLVEVYVFFALHPFTPILWPGTRRRPWLVVWKSLARQGWPHILQGDLPARALLVTSLELLLIHPDVKMSRSQASSPQWWSVSSIPFQEQYQAPLKKKKFFFSLSLETSPQNNMVKRRIANIQWEILSLCFSSSRKKSTHKSKQDGALEPHLLTWGNRKKEGKMPGPVPSIQHWACSTVMWHLKL